LVIISKFGILQNLIGASILKGKVVKESNNTNYGGGCVELSFQIWQQHLKGKNHVLNVDHKLDVVKVWPSAGAYQNYGRSMMIPYWNVFGVCLVTLRTKSISRGEN